MNPSDQLRFIASAIIDTHPDRALMLEAIAIRVSAMERQCDEIAQNSMAATLADGTSVVRLETYRARTK